MGITVADGLLRSRGIDPEQYASANPYAQVRDAAWLSPRLRNMDAETSKAVATAMMTDRQWWTPVTVLRMQMGTYPDKGNLGEVYGIRLRVFFGLPEMAVHGTAYDLGMELSTKSSAAVRGRTQANDIIFEEQEGSIVRVDASNRVKDHKCAFIGLELCDDQAFDPSDPHSGRIAPEYPMSLADAFARTEQLFPGVTQARGLAEDTSYGQAGVWISLWANEELYRQLMASRGDVTGIEIESRRAQAAGGDPRG